jgi:hypothetical protein
LEESSGETEVPKLEKHSGAARVWKSRAERPKFPSLKSIAEHFKRGYAAFLIWVPVHFASTIFSKFFFALLKGIGIRNILQHLVMILPNIGSLRL